MKRALAILKNDIRLQFRQGFYYAYLVVALLYIGLLFLMPENARAVALPLLIFSDPAMIGFFFIGALMFLERDEQSLQSLFTTPVRLSEYLVSKLLSLGIIGLLAGFAMAIAFRGFDFNPLYLSLGILLSSAFFMPVGVLFLCRAKDLNSYLIFTPFYLIVFFTPILGYLNILDTPLYYLLPTQAGILLIDGAFQAEGLRAWELLYAVACFLVWGIPVFLWAKKWMRKYIIEGRRAK